MSVNVGASLPHKSSTETPRGWHLAALFLTKQRNLQERGENGSMEGWRGVKYTCKELPTRVAAVTLRAAPG